METAGRQTDSTGHAELLWEVALCVPLPIEVLNLEQEFPLLDSTLENLGIPQSAVKEKVLWVDSKRTRVQNKSGKLKEKEVMVLEVRVKAQQPGKSVTQEVTYGSEIHSDSPYCRSSVDIRPWRHHQAENDLQPIEMTIT